MNASASSEESPRWAWFAHHQIRFVVAAFILRATADLSGFEPLGWAATLLLAAFIAGQFAVQRHTGILCGRCIDNVPTDASVQVVRRDWLLRLRHWMWAHPLMIGGGLLAVIGADIAWG